MPDYPNAFVLFVEWMQGFRTSEDIVMLYETSINPTVTGNFEICIKLDDWPLIEDHSILEVTSDSLIFDGEYYTKFEKSDILESRLLENIYVAKFPEKLENYSGKIEILEIGILGKIVGRRYYFKNSHVYSNSDESFVYKFILIFSETT